MTAKLRVLAVVALSISALADNEDLVPNNVSIDPATAKATGDALKAAFQEFPVRESVEEEAARREKSKGSAEMFAAAFQKHVQGASTDDSIGAMTLPSVMSSFLSNDTSSDLESDIAGLVLALGKGGFGGSLGFGGSGLGKSVKKIKAVIDKDMIPKINAAHKVQQTELNRLYHQMTLCSKVKDVSVVLARKSQVMYQRVRGPHKKCRATEASLYTDNLECWKDLKEKWRIKELRCRYYSTLSKRYGDQNRNKNIANKGGSEDVVTYVRRVSSTICGKPGGKGYKGHGAGGFADKLLRAKAQCESATKLWYTKDKACKRLDKDWHNKRAKCNAMQDVMDNSACKYAVDVKDACEAYDECFKAKKKAYDLYERTVRTDEADRKMEWKGTRRMRCIIIAFEDGKITGGEITRCKVRTHDTFHLNIKYPTLPKLAACVVPDLVPYTAKYKKAEFAPLPAMAKGKMDANPCTGVAMISTDPAPGSPKSCDCQRVTMNGPYDAGSMVKCSNCLTLRRSNDKSSCPAGTKLFSPQSRQDWETFLKSAGPLRAPHWIVDVTRPLNGCGGCTKHPMNSDVKKQRTWTTLDGSPWWLRSKGYNEPNGDYHANCYLDLWHNPKNADSVTFNDGSCSYHSKSYYCQSMKLLLKPKPGSPGGCVCKKVEIAKGLAYSGGLLVKCENCKTVRRSNDKNSCPLHTKIFAPQTRKDWKAFINSAVPLRAPHWIIDVTRPQNGCGGCTRHAMNSKSAAQSTWRTADHAPWWLRATRYNEPNGDYSANCYMDLWRTPPNENSITFNDGRCHYRSKSYYCQKAYVKPRKKTTTLSPPWRICCKAMTATCLACKKKVTVQEYCTDYPSTQGCPLASLDTTPRKGSPSSCKCKLVNLKGQYSAGALVLCQKCLKVSKSKDTNSCPKGTKIFSPKTRQDWKTIFDSVKHTKSAVADPNWIIDVTRPSNGCGGCTRNAMNSGNAAQASWRTSDGSPWWFRDNTYSEPNGDYTANCYLDLWHSPSASKIIWNDKKCTYHSKSYYCQPKQLV